MTWVLLAAVAVAWILLMGFALAMFASAARGERQADEQYDYLRDRDRT
jgi:hypothetical protein